MPAILYVVATPLGNLSDMSSRASSVLSEVPLVVAEDTRRTRKLLSHLGSGAALVSLHAQSPRSRIDRVLRHLAQGYDAAYVTDAGTPGVSDPGPELVSAARGAGFQVVPVPGPSAVATALSASGLPADRYLFLGFLPRKGRYRKELLDEIARSKWTTVVFEAPSRLGSLLEDLSAVAGAERLVVVARELTKKYEEIVAGTLAELAGRFDQAEVRGEITLVIAGTGSREGPKLDVDSVRSQARELLAEGLSTKDVVSQLTESHEISRNEAYRLVTELE